MKLHSDSLEELDVRKAASLAGVGFTSLSLHGSRSRAARFDVILTGSSGRRQNMGGPDEAATWDEWGIFLGHLHRLDPDLKSEYYQGREHYEWSTGFRFDPDFTPAQQHRIHKWEFLNVSSLTGASIFECYLKNGTGCGAMMQRLNGTAWADIPANLRGVIG